MKLMSSGKVSSKTNYWSHSCLWHITSNVMFHLRKCYCLFVGKYCCASNFNRVVAQSVRASAPSLCRAEQRRFESWNLPRNFYHHCVYLALDFAGFLCLLSSAQSFGQWIRVEEKAFMLPSLFVLRKQILRAVCTNVS